MYASMYENYTPPEFIPSFSTAEQRITMTWKRHSRQNGEGTGSPAINQNLGPPTSVYVKKTWKKHSCQRAEGPGSAHINQILGTPFPVYAQMERVPDYFLPPVPRRHHAMNPPFSANPSQHPPASTYQVQMERAPVYFLLPVFPVHTARYPRTSANRPQHPPASAYQVQSGTTSTRVTEVEGLGTSFSQEDGHSKRRYHQRQKKKVTWDSFSIEAESSEDEESSDDEEAIERKKSPACLFMTMRASIKKTIIEE